MSQNANSIINRLKEEIGIKTNKMLCEMLGIKSNTLSTWKIRETLDYSKVLQLCNEKNLDLNYIFFGIKEEPLQKKKPSPREVIDTIDLQSANFLKQTKIVNTNRNIAVLTLGPNVEFAHTLLVVQQVTPKVFKKGDDYVIETKSNKTLLVKANKSTKKNYMGPIPVNFMTTNGKSVEKEIHLLNVKKIWSILETLDKKPLDNVVA